MTSSGSDEEHPASLRPAGRGDSAPASSPTAGPSPASAQPGPSAHSSNPRTVVPPVKGSITVSQRRERVREYLAKSLLAILAGTVLLGAGLVAASFWLHLQTEAVEQFFAPVFSAVVAIAGSAVGFYFGSERLDKSVDDEQNDEM